MDEFVDRMDVQRRVLHLINSSRCWPQRLHGLSRSALNRWAAANGLASSASVVLLLTKISNELFFMATHSQEPLEEEHEAHSTRAKELLRTLEEILIRTPPDSA